MTNPFENPDGQYYALINDEGQYSLWPSFVQIPEGWSVAQGPASREACLEFIGEVWTDLRPTSLVRAMAG
ncbi:MbtH protein [Streptomyces sp. Ncost-T6T-1]|uniref:MbtH family protein n=1 Tax=Streptomyces sp. Ncost-T6T-1 TaxID=1100828 RepID=UPI000804C020|nr:MbtH family protein [Streptomyces sp. Ncost-T6T-1]SBU98638.1 MbtH protein [Streptomyces sp. Ncost-T6T-1]